ncbi:Hypothetical predicted protein [Olea europaea subsp. europaea]|uniref:Uncharacterized protein n=1 Tax=Olea europaea subsp. europaea TaxID=158383 RepID=A0A8S0T3T5_OLEEU|nr:Hypothetical predicted protein [Olea europaea subsp. europaea]
MLKELNRLLPEEKKTTVKKGEENGLEFNGMVNWKTEKEQSPSSEEVEKKHESRFANPLHQATRSSVAAETGGNPPAIAGACPLISQMKQGYIVEDEGNERSRLYVFSRKVVGGLEGLVNGLQVERIKEEKIGKLVVWGHDMEGAQQEDCRNLSKTTEARVGHFMKLAQHVEDKNALVRMA